MSVKESDSEADHPLTQTIEVKMHAIVLLLTSQCISGEVLVYKCRAINSFSF
jgi:hypothetical protein